MKRIGCLAFAAGKILFNYFVGFIGLLPCIGVLAEEVGPGEEGGGPSAGCHGPESLAGDGAGSPKWWTTLKKSAAPARRC
ncbi:MAG: hypothetical protein PHR77_15920 [Kiritimatiellae bacterium]|nr:hypothetical protein [Kiritimatiellia bacterium]MDD5520648.1 hypothetical protein [Kiritimatiellia bacterium]